MAGEGQGVHFGSEMSALANSFKARFNLGKDEADIPFFYTMPNQTLSPNRTLPKGIRGQSTAVELEDWLELNSVFDEIIK